MSMNVHELFMNYLCFFGENGFVSRFNSISLKGWEEYRWGCKPPLDRAQTIGVLKARKTIFRPFGAFVL